VSSGVGAHPSYRDRGGVVERDLLRLEYGTLCHQQGVLGISADAGGHQTEHLIADREALHTVSNGGDDPGGLLAQGCRKLSRGSGNPGTDLPIKRVDPGRVDLDPEFSRAWLGGVAGDQFLVFRAAVLVEHVYLRHRVLPLLVDRKSVVTAVRGLACHGRKMITARP